MGRCLRTISTAAIIITGIAISSSAAHATTFGFDDEKYLSSSGFRGSTTIQQNAVTYFGTSNGVSSAGIYQGNNGANSTQLKNVGSSTGALAGEWALSGGNFTDQFLSLTGWGQSLNVGQTVDTVYNRTNPLNGAVLYMQYQVGGANTAFTFNSFDLRGPNLPFTVEGFRGGVLEDSTVLSTSNNFSTYALNWANIDTVEIVSTSSLPVNWGSGTLYMDNVVLNNPVESVPEPASLALLGMGLAGLGFVRRRGGAAA